MRVIPNYRRYEPTGGFRAPPESGVVCMLCCYEISPEEEIAFRRGQICHCRCLEERYGGEARGGEELDGE